MWQRRIPTRYGLWTALSLTLFVMAGDVNWLPEGKTLSYWGVWAVFLGGDYRCSVADFLFVLAAQGLVLAVPSLVLGWVAQAAVGAALVAQRTAFASQPDAKLTPQEFLNFLAVAGVVNVAVILGHPFRDWADRRPLLFFPIYVGVFVLTMLGVAYGRIAYRRHRQRTRESDRSLPPPGPRPAADGQSAE